MSKDIKWEISYIEFKYPMTLHRTRIWGHCEKCVTATFHRCYPETEYKVTAIFPA